MLSMATQRESKVKSRDPEAETIRKNLRDFREAVDLSQDDAATASGVAIDNLRRYESGAVIPPASALRKLGEIYGHTVDDFFLDKPPAAKLDERPVMFFRSLPGVEIDRDLLDRAQAAIAEVNSAFRARKKSAKKR